MTTDATLTVTDRAADRIRKIVEESHHAKGLRVAVNGGGCSGFQYEFTLADNQSAEDTVLEHAGAVVIVDDVSLPLLAGSELDFVDDLMGQSFRMKNPQAKSSCGCGVSFSL
jgi:iron-sulfur cluster assembly accessory protein